MRIRITTTRRQIGGSLPVFRGQRQVGGELAIFRGARDYQYGRGIGNILRSMGKVLGPIARKYGPSVLKIGKKFVKHAIRAREQGASWGDAAKEGVLPAAKTALKEVGNPMQEEEDEMKVNQSESGLLRNRRRFPKKVFKVNRIGRHNHYNF